MTFPGSPNCVLPCGFTLYASLCAVIFLFQFLFTDMESHSDLPPATGPDALIAKDAVNNPAQLNHLPYGLVKALYIM